MLRELTPDDTAAVLELSATLGLFAADELDRLAESIAERFDPARDRGQIWLVDDDPEDGVVGVAYCGPEIMSDRVWNLYYIAVHADARRSGRGSALVAEIEGELVRRGQRLLLVETAGVESFEPTRAFYAARGFERDGVVRDYYGDGVDKVTFRKRLGGPAGG